MFKLQAIDVSGFWQTRTARTEFRDDVNIIIGRNGTGKTTFMNLVHAVLSVDIEALCDNPFQSIAVTLTDGTRTRTVRAKRIEQKNSSFPIIEYRISNRRFTAPLIGYEDGRHLTIPLRRRLFEESQRIKQELGKMVSVASLSVYRMSGEPDPEARERTPRRYVSNVDARLQILIQRLTQYQLELSNAARLISTQLQRDVLTSLLYTEETKSNKGYKLDFDEATERQNLVSAYRQLGVSGSEVSKKIQEHIDAVGKTIQNLRLAADSKDRAHAHENFPIDLTALEAFKLTRTVVNKSLRAKEKTELIFSPVEQFLKTLKTFIADKVFEFSGGELLVRSEGPIPLARLSSGEKQLLILLVEALLQRQQPYIFLADEPELSLHISWQRNIISAIRALNPNAQIVVATHSPEIAGKFRGSLLDMESILSAKH